MVDSRGLRLAFRVLGSPHLAPVSAPILQDLSGGHGAGSPCRGSRLLLEARSCRCTYGGRLCWPLVRPQVLAVHSSGLVGRLFRSVHPAEFLVACVLLDYVKPAIGSSLTQHKGRRSAAFAIHLNSDPTPRPLPSLSGQCRSLNRRAARRRGLRAPPSGGAWWQPAGR